MKKIVFGLAFIILLLSGCQGTNNKPSKSKDSIDTASTKFVKKDTNDEKEERVQMKKTIDDISEIELRKRIFIIYIKHRNPSVTNLNVESYFHEINLSKEESLYKGGISFLDIFIDDAKVGADFELNNDGTIIFSNTSGAVSGISEQFNANVIDAVTIEECNSIRDTLENFSYRAISTNEHLFQDFLTKKFNQYKRMTFPSQEIMQVKTVSTKDNFSTITNFASKGHDFNFLATTNSMAWLACTDDEIYSGGLQIVALNPGEEADPQWKLDEILTAEMLTYFDNTKINEEPQKILQTILNKERGMEQDLSKWSITEENNSYHFYYSGTTQAYMVRGRAVYSFIIYEQQGRREVINYELTKYFIENY